MKMRRSWVGLITIKEMSTSIWRHLYIEVTPGSHHMTSYQNSIPNPNAVAIVPKLGICINEIMSCRFCGCFRKNNGSKTIRLNIFGLFSALYKKCAILRLWKNTNELVCRDNFSAWIKTTLMLSNVFYDTLTQCHKHTHHDEGVIIIHRGAFKGDN